jgi:hypothetical protein
MTPTIVEKKTIDDCGLAWWFYHYHFSIANDIECVRIQFEYAGSSKCTPLHHQWLPDLITFETE